MELGRSPPSLKLPLLQTEDTCAHTCLHSVHTCTHTRVPVSCTARGGGGGSHRAAAALKCSSVTRPLRTPVGVQRRLSQPQGVD